MTPKQKAEELYRKYEKLILTGKYHVNGFVIPEMSKGCALMEVESIIAELEQLRKPEYTTFVISYKESDTMDGYEKIDYWKKVKTAIKKR